MNSGRGLSRYQIFAFPSLFYMAMVYAIFDIPLSRIGLPILEENIFYTVLFYLVTLAGSLFIAGMAGVIGNMFIILIIRSIERIPGWKEKQVSDLTFWISFVLTCALFAVVFVTIPWIIKQL